MRRLAAPGRAVPARIFCCQREGAERLFALRSERGGRSGAWGGARGGLWRVEQSADFQEQAGGVQGGFVGAAVVADLAAEVLWVVAVTDLMEGHDAAGGAGGGGQE